MSQPIHLSEAGLKKWKETEDEVKRLNEAVTNNPNDGDSWKLLGDKYSFLNKPEEALNSYKKALEIAPNNILRIFLIGLLYEGFGNIEELKKYADLAYSVAPTDFKSNSLKAKALVMERKLEEAIPYYQEMLKGYPTHDSTNYNLGNAYMAIGKKEEAVKRWETGVTSPFNDPLALCYQGQCYSKLGKKAEALAKFQKVKEEIEDGKTTMLTPVQVEYIKKSVFSVLEAEDLSKQAEAELEKAKKTVSSPVLQKFITRMKGLQDQQQQAQEKVIDTMNKPQSEEAQKNLNELDKLKQEFHKELAEMKKEMSQAISKVENQVSVLDKRVSNVEKGLDQVKEELDNKLDDFKKKLTKELEKQDLTAGDKVKIQGYFKAFLGTFSSAYVTAQVVDSGQVQVDAGNSATTILSTLASFAPFVGSILESSVKTIGEFLVSKEMKTSAKHLKGIAADSSELSQVIGKVGYEIAVNKDQQTRIISTTGEDVNERSENLFKKVVQFCRKLNQEVDSFLYSKLYKTPSERLGHNDANLLIEKWINAEITPFEMEEKFIKTVLKQTEKGREGQEKASSAPQEVKHETRSACCNIF